MKTFRMRKMLILTALVVSATSHANQQFVSSDPIDVEGYVTEPMGTDAELENIKGELRKQKQTIQINKEKAKTYNKLGRSTEKLSDATEEMIDERKESQAIIDQYNEKIKCLMEENPDKNCDQYIKHDKVQMAQAAPVQENIVVVDESETQEYGWENIKLMPYAGYTSFQSTNESLEAAVTAGLRVESDITDRVSIGLGFKYNSFSTMDYGTQQFHGLYSPQYFGAGGFGAQGREIEYSNINFDIVGKFFLTRASRFKPYIGGGLGYNRTTLAYADSQGFNDPTLNYNFGNEEFIDNNINALLLLGSEISFTKSIGASLEFSYQKGISSFGASNNRALLYDQLRLQQLGEELSEAHMIGVNTALVIYF